MMTDYFINIVVFMTIVPDKDHCKTGTVTKNISLLKQFYWFYKSIKKNWNKFPNRITVIHSVDYSDKDKEFLDKLDIDIIKTESDLINPKYIWNNSLQRYIVPTKIKGTHRLICECDQLAISNIAFNYEVDFQAGYEHVCIFDKNTVDKIAKYFNLKSLPYQTGITINNFIKYNYKKVDHNKINPYFNNGCIFIKEDFAKKFYHHMLPLKREIYSDNFLKDKIGVHNTNLNEYMHFCGQLVTSLQLVSLTDNWKPLPIGCNFLINICDVPNIKINKSIISHVHYCGQRGYSNILKYYPEYFQEKYYNEAK